MHTATVCVCVCSSTICFTCDVLQISTELLEAPREELQRDRGRRGRWRSLSPNLVVTTICCRHPQPDTRSQSGKRRREEMSRGKLGKPVNLGRRGAKKATVIVVCAGRKSMAQKKLICFDLFLEYICTYCVYVCVCVCIERQLLGLPIGLWPLSLVALVSHLPSSLRFVLVHAKFSCYLPLSSTPRSHSFYLTIPISLSSIFYCPIWLV